MNGRECETLACQHIHREGGAAAVSASRGIQRIERNVFSSQLLGCPQVGQDVLASLNVPPGTIVEVVKVANDPTVVNADISKLHSKYAAQTNASLCVLQHVESSHSPISIWNYIHTELEMDWIPELVCQLVRFLADAVPIPKSLKLDGEEASCQNPCPNPVANCNYDCHQDAFLSCD